MANYVLNFEKYHNVINNELTSTSATRHAICPSNEEPLWEVPVSTKEDLDRAVKVAKTAYSTWSKLSFDERAQYLNKFADAIEANKSQIIELLGKELGKPPQAAGFEFDLTMGLARETPKMRLKEEKPIDDEDRTAIVRYVPLGVVAGIIPWNFPLAIGVGKVFPALLAGNAFIWKPSPFSPYSALKIAELGAIILPPGVLQALSGDESLGPHFTAHPDIAKIGFTGSVETGKRIMAACASTLKRVTLELGGNDAAIICDDVDIEAVVPKRIYVHENIYDKFLAALVEATKKFPKGDHTEAQAFFGPIQNRMQYEKLQNFYSHIEKDNWKTALGGVPEPNNGENKGFYIPATIIDSPPEDSKIVTEEPFGPTAPVLKWKDEEDVIARANATRFGLGGSVWSKDVSRAKRMAEQLEAGSIWVNTAFELAPNVPFGGHKESGLGMEWGELGLKGWCNPQAYWIKHSG
ncbi:unnamed protein product [Clonostachys rhizophaga]|uniref:aldehyde dehydrogenase (NAD(+)) n=1 Tax=Clonostachys rhizophaga TaxID=160324 RepID=A0A9N9YUN8_9HYPO|nr:unnamed protein product [Clonostachys rhizophaga]